MEPKRTRQIESFSELLTCGQNLYTWEYNPELTLIHSNCPTPEMISGFIMLGNCKEYLLNYISSNQTKSLILSDTLGLTWIAAFEVVADQLCRIYIIGPAFTSELSSQKIGKQLESGNIPKTMRELFQEHMQSLPVIPLALWFQFGQMLHYTVTGEKISISDFNYQAELKEITPEKSAPTPKGNTWMAEQLAMKAIEEGLLDYKQSFSRLSMFSNYLDLTNDKPPLLQMKTSLISFITLATRAAIRGGLDAETAYHIGDYYINHVEDVTTMSEATRLNSTMYNDFIQRVNKCRTAQGISPAIQSCCNYIELHLTEKISMKQLAAVAGYSEYYLTQKFKKEVKKSVTQYIKEKKIEYAKKLLHSSTQSVQEISETLGYCNPSYFIETFRYITGTTPANYRESSGKLA